MYLSFESCKTKPVDILRYLFAANEDFHLKTQHHTEYRLQVFSNKHNNATQTDKNVI